MGAMCSKLIPGLFICGLWEAGHIAQSLDTEGTPSAAFRIKGLGGGGPLVWQGLSSAK